VNMEKYLVALKTLYAFYTLFLLLPLLLAVRHVYELLAILPILLFVYLLYWREKKAFRLRQETP